ncbi:MULTISPECIES: hypothetical protein [unclassified Pseudomonas]|uniref:hypothetical protein n=1 Tax=unclassified Pseudomonas TaxID=196821 RepID=UPI000837DE37|nr:MULTISPECIES: hypothetical protein [unclassified Pseudomonas]QIH09380.1 hypothetical protein ATY02_23030 [Pseudomonas sp. BIOMIG1BAC]
MIQGLGEGIYPSFCRDGWGLEAGWDHWSGDYLYATSVAGDDLLRQLFAVIEAGLASHLPVDRPG